MAHAAAPPSPPRQTPRSCAPYPPLKVEAVLRDRPALEEEPLPPGTRANGVRPPVPDEVITVRLSNPEYSHYEFKLKARSNTVARLVAKPSRGVVPPGRTAIVTLSTNDGGSADTVLAAGPVLCSRPVEGQAWVQTPVGLSSPYPSPDATDPRPARPVAQHTQQQHTDPYGFRSHEGCAAAAAASPPPQRGSLQSEGGAPRVSITEPSAQRVAAAPAGAPPSPPSRQVSPRHRTTTANDDDDDDDDDDSHDGATPPPEDISAVLAVSPMVPGDYGLDYHDGDEYAGQQAQQQEQEKEERPEVGTSVLERWGEYDALVAGLLGYLAEGCRVKRGSRSVHGAPTARIMQIVAARPAGAAAAGHGGLVRISKDGAAAKGGTAGTTATVEEIKLRSVSAIVLGRPLAGAPPPAAPQQQQHGAAATGGAATHQRTIALEDAAGALLAHVRAYTWDDFEASIAALFLLRAPGTAVRWQLPEQYPQPQPRKAAMTTTTTARGRAATAAAARTQSARTRSANNNTTSAPGSRTNTPRGRTSAGSMGSGPGASAAAPPSEEAIVAQLGIKPEAFRACRAAVLRRGPGALVTPLDLVEEHGMSLFHAVAAVELIGRFPAAPGSGDPTAALRTIPLTVRN